VPVVVGLDGLNPEGRFESCLQVPARRRSNAGEELAEAAEAPAGCFTTLSAFPHGCQSCPDTKAHWDYRE